MPSKSIVGELLGPLDTFLRPLKNRGITAEQLLAFNNANAALVDRLAVFINFQTLFSSPEEQIKRMLIINSELWHYLDITKGHIHRLGRPPDFPPPTEKTLSCVTLMYNSGDQVETFRRNWGAYWYMTFHKRAPRAPFWFKEKNLEPLRVDGKEPMPRPKGLFWAIVEFGRRYNKLSPREAIGQVNDINPLLEADNEVMLVGPELTLIPAMHPKWAAIAGNKKLDYHCPGLSAPGMRVSIPDACCPYYSREPGLPHRLEAQGIGDVYDYTGICTMKIPGWDSVRKEWITSW